MEEIKNKISEFIAKLNQREQILAIAGILVFVFIGANSVVESVSKSFSVQKRELEKVQNEFLAVPAQLERYLILNQRKNLIEKKYQEVQFQGGVLSHVEDLVRQKAGVESSTDYKINKLQERKFGGSYIQEQYKIEIYTTSIEKLAVFLKSLVAEQNPLVMTRLNIKKAPNKRKLIVQIDVSNFRKA